MTTRSRLYGLSGVALAATLTATLAGALPPGARAAVTLLPLGDSITHGLEGFAFDPGRFPESAHRYSPLGPPPDLMSYREHLHDLLTDPACDADIRWVGTRASNGRVPAVSEGRADWRADDFLTRSWADGTGRHGGSRSLAGWLATLRPRVVLMHLGTADLGQGQDAPSTRDDIARLLDLILSNEAGTIVLLANVLPISGWYGDHPYATPEIASDVRAEAARLAALLGTLAEERLSAGQPVLLVDVNSGFHADEANAASCPAGEGGDPANMTLTSCVARPGGGGETMADGIHPNLLGDRFIAERMFAALELVHICRAGR